VLSDDRWIDFALVYNWNKGRSDFEMMKIAYDTACEDISDMLKAKSIDVVGDMSQADMVRLDKAVEGCKNLKHDGDIKSSIHVTRNGAGPVDAWVRGPELRRRGGDDER
jgi:hypothetical protein